MPNNNQNANSISTESSDTVREVVDVLNNEAAAILAAANRIDGSVVQAVDILFGCRGRVIVTGMGKMGCIARKAAATFCSTGTPAIFLHPSEAVHGDLGIVTDKDVLVLLSNSGETREIVELFPFMARLGVPMIGLTGNSKSQLAQRCEVVLDAAVESEADPIAVAPTSSTTVALAMCDGLAIALMNRRGFTKEQFAIFHPGGNLGGKLLIQVADLMRGGNKIPKTNREDSLRNGIAQISQKGLGAVFVVSDADEVLGILTDGDLRRIIEQAAEQTEGNVLDEPLSNHMTADPKSIGNDALAAEALRLMEESGITVLPVVDHANEKLVGVIHLHDLIRAGLA
ncbi:MAG: SIS domain-containing protein [Mariniblastus sp.]